MKQTKKEFNESVENIIKNIDYPFNEAFVHTHLHTELSFLDGAGKISDLAKKCAEVNTPLVITDHGNVACTIRGYQSCKDNGIPFIRGLEAYIKKSDDDDSEEDYEGSYFHLILLPYTKEGFENINLLSSLGYVEGLTTVAKRPVPVIRKEWLKKYSAGIVATSACMFGEISANIWLHYPYLDLLKRINPKYAVQIIRVARKMIEKKKVLTKKSGLTVDDLSDDVVLDMILQKKKLKPIKKILLNEVSKASNEDIVDVAKSSTSYIDNIVSLIDYYRDIFDFFYLEIQDHNFFEQRLTTLIQEYIVESYDIGTKLVVTNDVHYIEASDWEVQDVLLCISTKKTINDKGRFKFDEHELYFKSPEELMNMFQYLSPEKRQQYMKTSTEIANICLNYQISLDEIFYPAFDIPEGFSNAGEFVLYQCLSGARKLNSQKSEDFRYKIFDYIDFEYMKNSIFEDIDFDTAFEYVKCPEKQSLILPMIQSSIDDVAKKVFEHAVQINSLTILENKESIYLEIIRRLIYEFSIIVIKEIPDYFLITKQIIDFARNENILVGPGRGSAAGSVVAYLLGITQLDPLEYALYFERFINPERNSYPDIDSDFPQRYLHYVREATCNYFGNENCCGVNAFGNIQNKRAIQDSFRVFGFEPKVYNRVSKEISNERPILESIMENREFKESYELEDTESHVNLFRKSVDAASKITGNVRQAGTHAAGMIITPRGMNMYKKLPVMMVGGTLNSQYDKNDIESAGFLKMDLLGIRNLDIIQDTLDLVKKYRNIDINIESIPLDDEATYKLYQNGDTDFIFQVESDGMKDFLKKLKPTNIEDIIVVLAGYRPGPMGYLEDYVKVRNGQKEAIYRHELLKPILEVTGGISFYQEQIMDIFKSLAGYSLGRADLVRRALGKKKKEILDKEKHNFIYGIQAKNLDGSLMFEDDGMTPVMEVKGCINNGIDEKTAEDIFQDILPFADYGFNKSHAAGYAILSYRTGYLKANFFLEYATSVLRSVQEDRKRLTSYANIVKESGVSILFPDINKSNVDIDIYDFENKIISSGLLSIKSLPEEMARNIIKERNLNGLFSSYDDFLKRMSKYHLDKKSMTALISAGAFDVFDKNMVRLMSYYEHFDMCHSKMNSLRSTGQNTIFDMIEFQSAIKYLSYVPDSAGYVVSKRLANLCEYNNTGIHPDVSASCKDVKNSLTISKRQGDEDYISKEGVVTGVLEDEFTISKKGKAYLNTLRTFDGDVYKIIISKGKVNSITSDITQYKKGMVVDLTGSFKFPKLVEDEETSDLQGYVNTDIVTFPWSIEIKKLVDDYVPLRVELNLNKYRLDNSVVSNYFCESDLSVILKRVLTQSSDDNGKSIRIYYKDTIYESNKLWNITLDDIEKLGCEYKII